MFIGYIMIGTALGLVSAVSALATGHSLLLAFGLYVGLGLLGTLVPALIVLVRQGATEKLPADSRLRA